MGKFVSVIGGLISMGVGAIGLTRYWPELSALLKGAVPAVLVAAGLIAVVAGATEIQESSSLKNKPSD
tara:strand:- start:148 stop:351 length:204 start_codon:yes stop_codon:yes gene_type:complete